jgi:TolA-binding protein
MSLKPTVSRIAYLLVIVLALAAEGASGAVGSSAVDGELAATLERSRALGYAEATSLLGRELPRAGTLKPYFLLELAERASSAGDWPRALEWCGKQDVSGLPDTLADRVSYRQAEALIATGDRDKGLAALQARIDSGKARDPGLWLLWFRESGLRDGSTGKKAVERMCVLLDAANPALKTADPGAFALSRYLAGLAAVRSGEWDFAARSLSRFTPSYDAKYPEYAPWAAFFLGWSHYRNGNDSEAIRAFSRYLDAFKGHERGWQAATAAALASTGIGADPLPFASRAVALAPTRVERAESIMLEASVLADRKDIERAEAAYSGVADGSSTSGLTPAAPRALFALAELAVRAGNGALAETRYLSISERFTKDPLAGEGLYRAGEGRFLSGDWARAAELFSRYRREWASGPFLDSALALGGEAYRKSGNADLAILWWEELLSKFPASSSAPRASRNLVDAYRAEGDYASALRAAENYRRTFPEEARLDGMTDAIAGLKRLNAGEKPDVASLSDAWEREGRAKTARGRSAGLALAREYLADYRTRGEAKALLQSIGARAPESPDGLAPDERATYAAAFALLGNTLRDEASFKDASRALLRAGSYYSAIDGERAAEALYGAVDSFIQSGFAGDAGKTVETLDKTFPSSAWTRRAKELYRSQRPE